MQIKLSLAVCEGAVESEPQPLLMLELDSQPSIETLGLSLANGKAALAQLPHKIGIDEKAIAKGHRYMTLVCDLEEATVEYIGDERRQASLAAYFQAFPVEARQAIEAISLDMWPPYIKACRDEVPEADGRWCSTASTSHALRRRGGGQGQEARAQASAGRRRCHAEQEQIPVAVQPGERARALASTHSRVRSSRQRVRGR